MRIFIDFSSFFQVHTLVDKKNSISLCHDLLKKTILLHFSFLCDTASLTNNQTGNQLCQTHIEFYVRHLSCQPDTSSFLLDTLSYLVRHIIVYFVLRSVLMNLKCQGYRTGVAKCPSQLIKSFEWNFERISLPESRIEPGSPGLNARMLTTILSELR